MKRLSHVLCGAVVMLMAAGTASVANAQALMVYKEGASEAQIRKGPGRLP